MLTTIHRFTPPTCTLEIKGKKSPLSRWTNQDILKKFKFKLSFDDPRLSSDKQIVLTGDRLALEQLKTSVDKYTQENLYNSFISNINRENAHFNNNQPYFEPKGLTNHELFFGSLNHDSTKNKMTLSTVQLFDLVTALEAFSTQINALPELEREKAKRAIPFLGGIAAVALAGIGITTTIIMLRTPVENIASSPKSESSDTAAQFNDVIPPETPPASRKKELKLKTNESISSAKRLPPPPAVSTPKPKPNIPDPADYPLPQVARQSGLKSPIKKEQTEEKQVESRIATSPQTTPEIKPQLESEIQLDSKQEQALLENRQEELDLSDLNGDTALKNSASKPNQFQEITAYFKDKWQPPTDLKQSLEYRLYLNQDGTIKRVIPIGKASELYLNKTSIPVQGETFISPLKESHKSTIRLLLNPDGGIKTLSE